MNRRDPTLLPCGNSVEPPSSRSARAIVAVLLGAAPHPAAAASTAQVVTSGRGASRMMGRVARALRHLEGAEHQPVGAARELHARLLGDSFERDRVHEHADRAFPRELFGRSQRRSSPRARRLARAPRPAPPRARRVTARGRAAAASLAIGARSSTAQAAAPAAAPSASARTRAVKRRPFIENMRANLVDGAIAAMSSQRASRASKRAALTGVEEPSPRSLADQFHWAVALRTRPIARRFRGRARHARAETRRSLRRPRAPP